MDIRLISSFVAIVVTLTIVLLAKRFLSQRARYSLYGGVIVVALLIVAYVFLNTRVVPTNFGLQPIVAGLSQPIHALMAPGNSERWYLVEKSGLVRIFENGQLRETPFLDIQAQVVNDAAEQGLLSAVFHPAFATNGYFYVYYTVATGSVLERFEASGDQANMTTRTVILDIPQDIGHHNGGHLLFGPDGYLYLSLGDGGVATEADRAQDLTDLLGSLLRLDVNETQQTYTIPADNPFVNQENAQGEIWAYGLRNPWRFAFDSQTGDLYIADVGESKMEEINFVPAGAEGGFNFGWPWYEGSRATERFEPAAPAATLTFPVLTYDHLALGGCSIVGGVVYRGQAMPSLVGKFVYGDYCTGIIWALERDGENFRSERIMLIKGVNLSSFAVDAQGELYLLGVNTGTFYRITE